MYRQGVNAFILNKNLKILLVQKKNYQDNEWDLPGGGVEKDESVEVALFRELKEEVGISNFDILELSPVKFIYNWPLDVQEHSIERYGIPYIGQEKHQYVLKFLGNDSEIVLQDEGIDEGLKKFTWVAYNELSDYLVFPGQLENAQKVLSKYFN